MKTRALLLFLLIVAAPFAGRAKPPFEALFSHRLELGPDGSPLVTVGIVQGEARIRVIPHGPLRIHTPDGEMYQAPAGARWEFRILGGQAAKRVWSVRAGDFRLRDEALVREALERWRARGFDARARTLGTVFGVRGKVVDNRRYVILLGPPASREEAEEVAAAARLHEAGVTLFSEVLGRASGRVEARGPEGVQLLAEGAIALEVDGEAGLTVQEVEHDMGYAAHGREDRRYRGTVFITPNAEGRAAAVLLLPLEELLRSIVPSEIFASAPKEALKAQAVAARGEILAKVGVRHLADPYLICAEQHCQVSKGVAGEHPRTDAAIRATWGEVLLGEDGVLVDTVYSSTCGGHTENNEAVWGASPDRHLRGRPDGSAVETAFPQGVTEEALERFLALEEPGLCGASSFSRQEKMRWERRFSASEMDRLLAPLGVGPIVALRVSARGVSGRATALAVTGRAGAVEIQGELNIRRRLGNLNSSLFVVEREGPADAPTAWRFRGAGWGHGVGMCQMGAIGRAERGEDYGAILRHYYGGVSPFPLY